MEFLFTSQYTQEILKYFYMNKTHHLCTPMIVQSLDVNNDHFRPQKEDEEILGPEDDQ